MLMGGVMYIDTTGIVAVYGSIMDSVINGWTSGSTLVAVDVVPNPISITPSIIDSFGAVYTYDSTASDFVVVDTSDITGTPKAISQDINSVLWIVDSLGYVW
jgi:hypothetical protein